MSSNIHKGLLQFIFSGAYMKRWNDKLRPMELIEIDKQAHKMIVAWLLCQMSGKDLSYEERLNLEEKVVEGALFDYLFRLVITDIKPPILYSIKENKDHYQQLAKWVIGEIGSHIKPVGSSFWEKFKDYVMQTEHNGLAADILSAAHIYASVWEFQLIRPLNHVLDDELPEVEARFKAQLSKYSGLNGMKELISGLEHVSLSFLSSGKFSSDELTPLAKFANLCGLLRFQKRWSQTPRVPETSVMGHMFIVACYSYFLSMALNACRARRVNNFFTGLFHDLPELLTRDIISPVKKSFSDLEVLIKEYEKKELDRRIFKPLEDSGYNFITKRLAYYLGLEVGSEFYSTIVLDKKVKKVDFDFLHGKYNQDKFDPKDGEAIKVCDVLAAYIEAYVAMRNGITSDNIQQAFWRMREQNSKLNLGGLHIGSLFTDFD